MFSTTTTASSTTKPVAMVKAMSERMSRLKPARYMTPNEPMIETGTAMLGMIVARASRRKKYTTMMTSNMAITSVISVSSNEARMVSDLSPAIFTFMPAGIAASMRGSSALSAIHRVDDIGAWLRERNHRDRRVLVEISGVAQVFDRVRGPSPRPSAAPRRRCDRR